MRSTLRGTENHEEEAFDQKERISTISNKVESTEGQSGNSALPATPLRMIYVYSCIILLFLNYFLAQYKFILSYFQDSVLQTLSLSSTEYGVLSGYATGISYALLALPVAYVADYTTSRVWILSVLALWWSLCVVFQGLSHNFTQILLARIGMGFGQACVEPLSLSLISDLVPWQQVFLGESIFYVGVYIGEAVSGQIATAFTKTGTNWQVAMKAIGITGTILAVLLRLLLREPQRQNGLLSTSEKVSSTELSTSRKARLDAARADLQGTVSYVLRMRSFWLLVLSASFRQLAGNVFGYYMPSYLSNVFPSQPELLSRYGIIVGVVGTVSILSGGALTTLLWHRTKLTPIYLTSIGGMISSIFVLLMIFSIDLAGGDQNKGTTILYGTMSAAYLTAETWLGALFALVAFMLPPRYKTFGLAIWGTVQVLVYSAGPEIIGLALRNSDPGSKAYTQVTKTALAVIIPVGYWLAGVGLLLSVPLVKRDLRKEFVIGPLSNARKWAIISALVFLLTLTISLFIVSIVYKV